MNRGMNRCVSIILAGVCGLVLVGFFMAAGASARPASVVSQPGANPPATPPRPQGEVPPALRPALYRALAKAAGTSYRINANGCATLPKQGLKACFGKQGAHFAGSSSPLVLHLAAYGRGDKLSLVAAVQPKIAGNRVSYAHGNLTEWWRVLPMGFEQGFTIAKHPSGHGELTLVLAASRQDAGAPLTRHSRESGNPVKNTLAWGKLRYGKLVVTDANGKVIPATLTEKGNRILIAVNDRNAAYPLTVDPLVWIKQKVEASDAAPGNYFGASVAILGNTAVIGAPYTNDLQGVAYVFVRSNGTWTQTQELTASDAAAHSQFGYSVALSGSTILIGAIGATVNGNTLEGAAYVFTESNGAWTQTQKLTEKNGEQDDVFGGSIALAGSTAFIGADQYNIDSGTGKMYVYTESGGTWTQTAKLTPADLQSGDAFGISVAVDGTTALIGASGRGAVYVYNKSNGSWAQTQRLTASDGNDDFGHAVAFSGETAVVGAPFSNVFKGAVYVFTESNDTWTQTQKLVPGDLVVGSEIGTGMGISGSTLLIGNRAYNDDTGEVYVYKKVNGTWSLAQKLFAGDGTKLHFGGAIAFDGLTALIAEKNGLTQDQPSGAFFFGASDLGLTVSAPQSVGQGQQYVSQTIATNNASAASPAASATITVPAAASFVSATATQGSCSEASGMVTCDFGQIPGNAGMATANVTLKATGAPGTTIENTAGIAKATPALTASAATTIGEGGACQPGYTEFSGHLDAGGTFTSSPITVTEAGQKYVDLTAPASFAFFAITDTRYGQHTYVYPHAKHGHRWGAAGSYQVGVEAGSDAGGDYTLCVNLNPAQ